MIHLLGNLQNFKKSVQVVWLDGEYVVRPFRTGYPMESNMNADIKKRQRSGETPLADYIEIFSSARSRLFSA